MGDLKPVDWLMLAVALAMVVALQLVAHGVLP
jgi:hypothetical protein